MTKTTIKLTRLTAILVIVLMAGCSKDTQPLQNASPQQQGGLKSAIVACNAQFCTLWAGQKGDWGEAIVSNDAVNLYVTYRTTIGTFGNLHLWVGNNLGQLPLNKAKVLVPGQFPYIAGKNGLPSGAGTTEYVFTVPLSDLGINMADCPNPVTHELYIVAHADMSAIINGVQVNNSAFAGCSEAMTYAKTRWFYYMNFTPACCAPAGSGICSTYQTETAFGGATLGSGNAWWYYFDTNNGSPQAIWAGQHANIGSAVYSTDNEGTITITLNDCWELNPVNVKTDKDTGVVTISVNDEPVKIQGYDEVPDKRPVAGHFEFKGTSLTVTGVGTSPYYVIHLDVRKCTTCVD